MMANMRYSNLVQRVTGEGADAWQIYYKANELARQGKPVINLCIGDPDFSAPDVAKQALIKAVEANDTHYADIPGRPALRAAVAEAFQAQTGVPTSGANVIFMAGAQNALFAVCQCLFQAGDEVIVPEPTYVTYEATIQATGATIVKVPSPSRLGFHIDRDAMERAVSPKTRGIMFATPNNPTGAVTQPPLPRLRSSTTSGWSQTKSMARSPSRCRISPSRPCRAWRNGRSRCPASPNPTPCQAFAPAGPSAQRT
jgi:aspartate/methionine/tyrosine aminotransferase